MQGYHDAETTLEANELLQSIVGSQKKKERSREELFVESERIQKECAAFADKYAPTAQRADTQKKTDNARKKALLVMLIEELL